jgi:hypothetical protein
MNKLELYSVPVPIATDTYSPVSHQNIIEAVQEQLYKRNFSIVNEKYNVAANGNKVIGYYSLNYNNDPEMGIKIAFRNSYDKSMSVAFVSGGEVWICSNGMVKGDIQYVRKHTGSVVNELNVKIIDTINLMEDEFIQLKRHSEQMKQIELTKVQAAEMYGRMFMIDDIITPTQLSVIKKELDDSKFESFKDETLWSAYNHVTFALKEAHPLNYIDQHVNLHKFVEQEFQLV